MKTEDWLIRKIPTETKKGIQELAKKEGVFANEKVAEILNDYLYDIELGRNKNYFDRRWQQVIDSYEVSANAQKILADAQNENTEAFGKSFSTLTKRVIELQNLLFAVHEEVEILRGVQQMLIGYSPEESKKFAEVYKKYVGEALKNESDFTDLFEKNEDDWFEGEEY
ncbi:hypothetical protein [Lactococcus termiticola]|uniref:Uncharacterized protein n=1 Tax=Lactococcus termiticola TaxID=2169526 RepID=A0A2R5HFF0_9LACT|nr:hypothetical protein [Lactococcus termiticola]GBG96777.1 hypothetical protein NtB2_00901 [Lactococcus termiticola]